MVEPKSDMSVRPATPWWHWLVGALGVAWSLGGVFDYLMTQTRNADYLANIPQPLLDYFYAMPTWLEAFWALAVWGGMVGWGLVLLRSRWALWAFAVSLGSMIVNFGYALLDGGLAMQAEYMGAAVGYGMTAAVVIGAVFALWYARHMIRRGVLR